MPFSKACITHLLHQSSSLASGRSVRMSRILCSSLVSANRFLDKKKKDSCNKQQSFLFTPLFKYRKINYTIPLKDMQCVLHMMEKYICWSADNYVSDAFTREQSNQHKLILHLAEPGCMITFSHIAFTCGAQ